MPKKPILKKKGEPAMYCSTHYDRVRSFLAPLAALLWTIGAGLILTSGGLEADAGITYPPADTLDLAGSLSFLLGTLLLFGGMCHRTVMTAMAIWFLSSVAILIAPHVTEHSTVHMTRVIGVAIASAWSFIATERDYIRQKHGGTEPVCGFCYPQFLPFLILFASNWPFIQQTFAGENTWYQAASVLTGLGDLAFAFSRQIYRPKLKAA